LIRRRMPLRSGSEGYLVIGLVHVPNVARERTAGRARHPGQRRTERIPRSYWLAVLVSAVVPVCASCARTVKGLVLETKVLIVSFKYVISAFNSVNFSIKTPSLGIAMAYGDVRA